MRRREFISLLGGAAVWPFVAAAQQAERLRRIGILMQIGEHDAESKIQVAAFLKSLEELGWIVGRNLQIDMRWAGGDSELIRQYAVELVALKPEVILAPGGTVVGALQRASRTLPIVFVNVTDPVGRGYIENLSRPGRNASGFTSFEFGMGGQWLQLLKESAPGVTRVAVLRDPVITAGIGYLAAIHALAPSFRIEVNPIDVRDARDMERAVAAFASRPNGGVILTPDPAAIAHRGLVIKLASRHRLPAIYPFRYFAAEGGLISYGPDAVDAFRRAAGYVDRVLKGERPADLPVQAPTKFELVVNLKTAKALGLALPTSLLARANEVIE
ncbi:MAG TPA: ABC transporter substrate-binding protein [Pseudolabrys sp.]|nr:ABC transporter substrate-binding protein [Pseudolabrys sp.]